MKRRFCILAGILMLAVCFVPGCQNTSEDNGVSVETENSNSDSSNTQKKDSADYASDQEQKNDKDDPDDTVQEKQMAVIYSFNENGEQITRPVEITDEKGIWQELQKDGILTEECEILSISRDDSTRKIDLDFNKATGDRVRSMGTTGEIQILGCIVNSYLDTYGCDGIRLTEEGKAFESSHASYDGYSGKITFE